MKQIKHSPSQSGFALLITIIVLSVVVAVTLSIVELTIKQLELSVDSTDSEIAFHAANAGLECARYTRRKESDDFEDGSNVRFYCFGQDLAVADSYDAWDINDFNVSGSNRVTRYTRNFNWGSGLTARCSAIDIVSMVASTSNIRIGDSDTPLVDYFPGFNNGTSGNSKNCLPGERCTLMLVTGYSSACNQINTPGTLKREILLEL